MRDLTIGHGYDSSMPEPGYKPALPLSGGQMITFSAADEDTGTGLTLTIRTSGTEPKVRFTVYNVRGDVLTDWLVRRLSTT